MKYYIGIDVGGTTIKGVLLNEKKQIKKQIKILTEKHKGKKAILTNIASMQNNLLQDIPRKQFKGMGIGIPGTIDRKRKIILACPNLLQLNNTKINKIFKNCKIENDANCAALAASVQNKKRHLVCLTIGTGVGGGIIINNRIYTGKANAGEIGHMSIEKQGRKCRCGNKGCLEEYISARGILNTAKQKGIKENSVIILAEKARKNKKYRQVFKQMGKDLGVGLTNIVNIFNPEQIALAGGITKTADLFFSTAKKELKKRAILKPCEIKILKQNAGAYGAALLAIKK